MLETISARQLLLEPLDIEGRWFRYHHLMGEYLRRRLETRHRDEVVDLHRRACQWYAKEEQWTDAVKHAIAAGDTQDAVSLMGHCAMALVTKGDLHRAWKETAARQDFDGHVTRSQHDRAVPPDLALEERVEQRLGPGRAPLVGDLSVSKVARGNVMAAKQRTPT